MEDYIIKRIAVICALPNERNTGMATVDLAARSVILRMAPQAKITLYTLGKPNQWTYGPGELPFEYANILDDPDQYLASDVFIFWGDFLHSRSYWKFDRGTWDETQNNLSDHELSELRQNQYENYSKYIFLTSLPLAALEKTIIFGSTLITNDAADESDPQYFHNYHRLFTNAGYVFLRDAISAAKVSPLRKDVTLGCDCAFLLERSDLGLLTDYQPAQKRRHIGVFLGRSRSKVVMLLFARLLAFRMGMQLKWLPWFWSRGKMRVLARMMGIRIEPGFAAPGALLSRLEEFELVITDTYHLCVNAWQLGIPAICVGEGGNRVANSLGDKKKELLYEMYGARPFYVFLESLVPWRIFSELERVEGVVGNPETAAQIIENIEDHRKVALDRLHKSLEDILVNIDETEEIFLTPLEKAI